MFHKTDDEIKIATEVEFQKRMLAKIREEIARLDQERREKAE